MSLRFNVVVPDLGHSNREVVVRHWFFSEGQYVDKHTPIVELASSNFGIDLPSPENAHLYRIIVAEGQTATTGATVAEMVLAEPGSSSQNRQTARPSQPQLNKKSGSANAKLHGLETTPRWMTAEFDLSGVLACRRANPKPSSTAHTGNPEPLPFVIQALAQSLAAAPALNAKLVDGHLEHSERVQLSVMLMCHGQLTPALVKDPDRRSISELEQIVGGLTTGEDTADTTKASFTLYFAPFAGIVLGDAQIVAPQVAALSVGGLANRPVAVGHEGEQLYGVRPLMGVCLNYRPYLIGYPQAAKFLQEFKSRIEAYSTETDIG